MALYRCGGGSGKVNFVTLVAGELASWTADRDYVSVTFVVLCGGTNQKINWSGDATVDYSSHANGSSISDGTTCTIVAHDVKSGFTVSKPFTRGYYRAYGVL